ncbi:MAG: GntR family transcriptional regulator [Zoogloeaceae bacterium]|nr:GntR family transcriptional regulator [Zoogloeaceae bacterium]
MNMINSAERDIFHRHTLCDALADSIRERLFEHEFAPGDVLDAPPLAAYYGIRRSTLTEALRQLARERLLVAREQAYRVAKYRRSDIEAILTALEQIRLLAIPPASARNDEPHWRIAASPYWGDSGFVVTRPFVVAARNLYHQLRASIGPALAKIETACLHGHDRNALAQAVANGERGPIENFYKETAQTFRQQVLNVFDVA